MALKLDQSLWVWGQDIVYDALAPKQVYEGVKLPAAASAVNP